MLTLQQSFDKSLICRLAEQVVSEPVTSIKRLKGGAAYNYEVNRHIIFKLPRLQNTSREWQLSAKCAPVIQRYLPVKIPQMILSQVSVPQEREPLFCCFYEKIAGHPISRNHFSQLSTAQKINFFEQLSAVACLLHMIPIYLLPIRVPSHAERRCPFNAGLLQSTKKMVSQRILKSLDSPDISDEKEVLCHTDLHSENLCIDRGNITGILDFELMSRGSSALEFQPTFYQSSDLALWIDIYQSQSGCRLNKEKIMFTKRISDLVYRTWSLFDPLNRPKRERRAMEIMLRRAWGRTRY
ncbi:MAG: aminoglycoside phosphotransferase family protein [Alphaproteobacteria bacterium]|nr:aminoglycoside phosphotransferase family protein [Alphaproteobacteria bacterium]